MAGPGAPRRISTIPSSNGAVVNLNDLLASLKQLAKNKIVLCHGEELSKMDARGLRTRVLDNLALSPQQLKTIIDAFLAVVIETKKPIKIPMQVIRDVFELHQEVDKSGIAGEIAAFYLLLRELKNSCLELHLPCTEAMVADDYFSLSHIAEDGAETVEAFRQAKALSYQVVGGDVSEALNLFKNWSQQNPTVTSISFKNMLEQAALAD